ncbi:MAG: flagellar hook-basal body complex protein FliE [Gammaproteobacteria bacterium]|nr:flagellar hook-basal body complex protein FliE [Gammaproteobacteria bacterium]
MNEINPQQILNQIRALNSEMNSAPSATPPASDEFGNMLRSALSSVNEAQQQATGLSTSFVSGSNDANLAEVMLAAQKADLSFRAMTEVRNKLVNAYQEIMNMPV